MAWLAGWDWRLPIEVATPGLTAFPVYLSGANFPAHYWTTIQADGDDIRVTEADGTTNAKAQLVSLNAGLGTQELHFKALTTPWSGYLYYGNAAATAIPLVDQQAVWSAYLMVLHLHETAAGTGTADVYVDATGNAYHGDDYVDPGAKVGKLFATGGETFDGSDDYIQPSGLASASGSYGLSYWIKSSQVAVPDYNHHIFDTESGRLTLIWQRTPQFNGVQAIYDGTDFYNFAAPPNDGLWHHQFLALDGGTGTAVLRTDGGAAQNASYVARNLGAEVRIGCNYNGTSNSWLEGCLDEFRLMATTPSAAWMAAEHANLSSPGTFYIVGPGQTPGAGTVFGNVRIRAARLL